MHGAFLFCAHASTHAHTHTHTIGETTGDGCEWKIPRYNTRMYTHTHTHTFAQHITIACAHSTHISIHYAVAALLPPIRFSPVTECGA